MVDKQEKSKKEKKPWSTKKKAIFWPCMAMLAVIAGIGAYLVCDYISGMMDPMKAFHIEPTTTAVSPATPTNSNGLSASPLPTQTNWNALSDPNFANDRVNILLLGIDSSYEREARSTGAYRSDTMILLSLDFIHNKVYMLSIPRDTYTHIYGRKAPAGYTGAEPYDDRARINTAFTLGGGENKKGFDYARHTVSDLLGGIDIQYYVGIKMNAVKDVVNALGGVDYDVDVEVKMGGRELHKGQQHLDGQQVLDYCRQRKESSDPVRTDRQRKMILTILDQLKTKGTIMDIPNVYSALQDGIFTNMNFQQIVALSLYIKDYDLSTIQSEHVPGNFLNMSGTSLWGIYQKKLSDLAADWFGVNRPVEMDNDVSVLRTQVKALNEALYWGHWYLDHGETLTNYNGTRELTSAEKIAALQSLEPALQNAVDLEDITLLEPATAAYKDAWNSANADAVAKVTPDADAALTRTDTALGALVPGNENYNKIKAAKDQLEGAKAANVATDIMDKTEALIKVLNELGMP